MEGQGPLVVGPPGVEVLEAPAKLARRPGVGARHGGAAVGVVGVHELAPGAQPAVRGPGPVAGGLDAQDLGARVGGGAQELVDGGIAGQGPLEDAAAGGVAAVGQHDADDPVGRGEFPARPGVPLDGTQGRARSVVDVEGVGVLTIPIVTIAPAHYRVRREGDGQVGGVGRIEVKLALAQAVLLGGVGALVKGQGPRGRGLLGISVRGVDVGNRELVAQGQGGQRHAAIHHLVQVVGGEVGRVGLHVPVGEVQGPQALGALEHELPGGARGRGPATDARGVGQAGCPLKHGGEVRHLGGIPLGKGGDGHQGAGVLEHGGQALYLAGVPPVQALDLGQLGAALEERSEGDR